MNDFKKIKHYTVYINNVIWSLSFQEHRIIVNNNKNRIEIDGCPVLIYDVSNYETYYKAFLESINDINNLYFCKKCNILETDFCKTCKLNNEVDKLNVNFNEECPICYEKITVRYITICDDIRHKICQNCNIIDLIKCPICRNNKYKNTSNINYSNEENDELVNEIENSELENEIENETENNSEMMV